MVVESVVGILKHEHACVLVIAEARDQLQRVAHGRVTRRQRTAERDALLRGYVRDTVLAVLRIDVDVQVLGFRQRQVIALHRAITLVAESFDDELDGAPLVERPSGVHRAGRRTAAGQRNERCAKSQRRARPDHCHHLRQKVAKWLGFR